MKLVIERNEKPHLSEGASLEWTGREESGIWSVYTFGQNVGHVLAKFRTEKYGNEGDYGAWRVVAHRAFLGNARFWSYVNGSWVKITLRPGQKLHWAAGGPNDEGVNVSCESWHFDDYDGCVYSNVANYGYDCDGRYSSESEYSCSLVDLRANEVDCDLGAADLDEKGQPVRTPNWERVRASQRDYAAEAMGY